MKISEVLGGEVISLSEGITVATVLGLKYSVREKRFLGLIVFDNEENELYLPLYRVYGANAYITVRNSECFKSCTHVAYTPLGNNVLSVHGDNYGILKEVEIDNRGKVLKLITDKTILDSPNIVSMENIILLGDIGKTYNFKSRRNFPKTSASTSVKIMNENTSSLPRLTATKSMVIGNELQADLYDKNNELVAKKHTLVDSALIANAITHGVYGKLLASIK